MFDYLSFLYNINFGKDKFYYKAINDIFGLRPNNIELYKLALIHKSASVVLEDGTHINNERLEFLGDAIIEAVTSDMLYVEFPYENEGFLTQLRAKIVSRQSLNYISERMGIDSLIVCQSNIPMNKKHLGGDAFEALLGAIYLDKGFDFANRLLINRIFGKYIQLDKIMETETDYKSRIIEHCQRNRLRLSINSLPIENFSEKRPQFTSVFVIDGKEYGYGVGGSKKEAEQRAANNSAKALGL